MRSLPASRKVQSAAGLAPILRRAASRGRRVVFTNGCFDLVHAGHVRLLERAKSYGDILVVGLNSDQPVRRLKGRGRPILPQAERALLLAALESVDYVTIFNQATPQQLIERLRPHVLIKGADWAADRIVGADLVRRWGGRIVRFPLVRGRSTSAIISQIRRRRAA